MSAHAKLGPSAAKRWMTCPGSTRLLQGVEDKGSEPAAMGTYCHEQLARMLLGKSFARPGGIVTVDGFSFPYTPEMFEWVNDAALWVKSYMQEHPTAHLLVEQHSPVGDFFAVPDLLWGTSDIVIVDEAARHLVVADAKFGFEEVDSEENPQVSLYAIGIVNAYGWDLFETVDLVILQPRSPEPVKVERLLSSELHWRAVSYQGPVLRAVNWPTAVLAPSDDACRWCRAASRCPALAEAAQRAAQAEFAQPELLTDEALLDVLEKASVVRKHLAAVEEYVLRRLAVGAEMPGWKRVRANAHRKWVVEPKVVEEGVALLGADPRALWDEPSLKSPAQVEKLLKLKLPEALAAKPEGSPTLARENDPREALSPEFAPVGEE